MIREIPEIHKRAIIIAGHTDIIPSGVDHWRLQGEKAVLEKRHLPRLRKGGINVICEHLGGDTRYGIVPSTKLNTTPLQRLMRMIDHAHMEAEESESIIIVKTLEDIQRAKETGKIGIVMCLEGGSALEEEIAILHNLHRLGVRSLGLTHNWRNPLADGASERSGGGLTYFGVEVVKECNSLGIIVDVAHLSDKGIEEVLNLSTTPVISSHANARTICHQVRNLSDDHIRAIAKTGGVIGVHAINFLISESVQPTLDDLLKHVVHIAEIGGVECVGLGPDLMEEWQEGNHKAVTEGAAKFASIPVRPTSYTYPQGMSSLAELPNFTNGLIRVGFSNEDILKILGGNFLRVYGQVWKPAISGVKS